MTTTKIYSNLRNPHKYLDVRCDGHGHYAVCQFMAWGKDISASGKLTVNRLGGGGQRRISAKALMELLADYMLIYADTVGEHLTYVHTGRLNGYYKITTRK